MTIYCIGLNHETAPVEVREQFCVIAPNQGVVSHEISQLKGVSEAVLLSTCNRMEVYLAVDNVESFFDRWHQHQVEFAFGNVASRPRLEGLGGDFFASPSSGQNDRNIQPEFMHFANQFQAIHFWHLKIRQDQINVPIL